MQILNVYPKDWHVQVELSLTQVNQLLDFLDSCEFIGDPTDPKMNDCKHYVMDQFFPMLDNLSEDMKKGVPDGS